MANKGAKSPVRQPQRNAYPSIDRLLAQRQYEEACASCEKLIERASNDATLLHKFGVAMIGCKKYDRAAAMLEKAARLASNDARILNDLGIAYEKADDFAAAEKAYLGALRIAPSLAEAHSNLADLLFKLERPDEAIRHAEMSTRLAPANPLSWVALGETRLMQGNISDAIAAFEKAVGLTPPQAKAFCSLARTYARIDRKEEAVAILQRARTLLGDEPTLLNDLGLALGSLRRYGEAHIFFEMAYRQLSAPAILYNLLTNLAFMRRIEDLLGLADEVLKHPQPNVALSPLFSKASEVCQWQLQEKLLPHFLEWCAMDDRKMTAAGHSLLSMLPIPSIPYGQIRNISERVTATYRNHVRHYSIGIDFTAAMQPHPKLRIGYLSGDFRSHVVNYFVSGQFSNYDRQHFEVYCYSNLPVADEDDITEQYRGAVDKFVRIAEMDDVALARKIADDGVHLLIDLSGYTGETRLSVMFHKPAPIQLTYLGYPFTTGLSEVDYVLSDPWLNGPDNAKGFTEQILEIPHSFISVGDLQVRRDDPTPPCRRNGHVTFGSLNNSYKLNRDTIAAWSRILKQVAASRMVLNHPNYALPLTQENILHEFEVNGIERERISIVTARHPQGRHLHWYNAIDIVLDSFPQTGGTTTTEALWMGVPVVTLVGSVHYQRLSYSILKNCDVDIDDLIAFNIDDYVSRAVALGLNEDRIAELHAGLLAKVHHSLLCDPARQVRHYEEALIDGWNRKFPEQAKFTPETFAFTRLESPAKPWVATVADPRDLHRYVIDEQGRWFAPEYELLGQFAKALEGELAVEIGGEPGYFSLELAHAGMQTLSLATSTVAGRLVQAAAERGGVSGKVEVRLESAKTNLLDRAGLRGVSLLRIGVEANDGHAGVIANNPDFWANNAPLVLLSVHNDKHPDLSAAQRLAAMGYGLYRLQPGPACFVRQAPGEALDPYVLYLLACPAAREVVLRETGLLVSEPKAVPAHAVDALSESDGQTDQWRRMDEWIVGCAQQAHGHEDAGIRLGYLQLATKAQLALLQSMPSTTRRITLVRLLCDSGRRADAIPLLNQCLDDIERGCADVTLPFLAPSPAWDDIPAADRLAEWLLASILETRVRLAAHSTYFLDDDIASTLEMVTSLGFDTVFSRSALHARQVRQSRS